MNGPMTFPTRLQGEAAWDAGITAGIAGLDVDDCPWDRKAGTNVEQCLAVCWRRGHSLGRQEALQRKYGDPPDV